MTVIVTGSVTCRCNCNLYYRQ